MRKKSATLGLVIQKDPPLRRCKDSNIENYDTVSKGGSTPGGFHLIVHFPLFRQNERNNFDESWFHQCR